MIIMGGTPSLLYNYLTNNLANATEIVPHLWLGDDDSSQSDDFLTTQNIKAIVNATTDVPTTKLNITYLRVPVNDSRKARDIAIMTIYLPEAVQFVHMNRDHYHRNVLVHCHAGVQRSATVVAAYLMKYYNFTLLQSINYVVSKRPQVFFNGNIVNFMYSLIEFQDSIRK